MLIGTKVHSYRIAGNPSGSGGVIQRTLWPDWEWTCSLHRELRPQRRRRKRDLAGSHRHHHQDQNWLHKLFKKEI